jgi:hypothetical protein
MADVSKITRSKKDDNKKTTQDDKVKILFTEVDFQKRQTKKMQDDVSKSEDNSKKGFNNALRVHF